MSLDARCLDAILREDLYSFIQKTCQTLEPMQQLLENWHLEAIAWHLKQCMTGEIRRLIITLPPRSLKSVSASVAFPAYVLGHDPTKKILCVSYSADLAGKNARECRSIMQSDWYRRLFPHTHLGSRAAEHDFHTTMRGYRYTTSVCGTLTGRGGNIIIIDDPMKAEEAMSDVRRKSINEWFDNTLYSRLDNKKSDVIILIMQRLHMDDMVGHVLQKEKWVHLNLPAIAPVDEDIEIGPGRHYSRTLPSAKLKLFKSFVQGLSDVGQGLVAQRITDTVGSYPMLGLRLDKSSDAPEVRFLPTSPRKSALAPFDDRIERHNQSVPIVGD